jgi:hypothetical protein
MELKSDMVRLGLRIADNELSAYATIEFASAVS